jgi:hypothetical protein
MEKVMEPASAEEPGEVRGPRTEALGLPIRQAADLAAVRKVRLMDDPEILERVLEGLLNLP